LGTLYCIDGSLFPVISSMLWAEYTTNHQALKLHLCFELNRMIPVDFWVGSGNSSERDALRTLLAAGVTYIADRGYMSFQLCHEVCQAQAHFIFRAKTNLVLTVVESLPISLPTQAQGLFSQLTDELIRYDNDPQGVLYRLVRFYITHEAYYLLTDRRDLTTFQIILLYAYRWQIDIYQPYCLLKCVFQVAERLTAPFLAIGETRYATGVTLPTLCDPHRPTRRFGLGLLPDVH